MKINIIKKLRVLGATASAIAVVAISGPLAHADLPAVPTLPAIGTVLTMPALPAMPSLPALPPLPAMPSLPTATANVALPAQAAPVVPTLTAPALPASLAKNGGSLVTPSVAANTAPALTSVAPVPTLAAPNQPTLPVLPALPALAPMPALPAPIAPITLPTLVNPEVILKAMEGVGSPGLPSGAGASFGKGSHKGTTYQPSVGSYAGSNSVASGVNTPSGSGGSSAYGVFPQLATPAAVSGNATTAATSLPSTWLSLVDRYWWVFLLLAALWIFSGGRRNSRNDTNVRAEATPAGEENVK